MTAEELVSVLNGLIIVYTSKPPQVISQTFESTAVCNCDWQFENKTL